MAYGLAVVVIVAAYLILSGRYERIRIQKLKSNRITNIIFFSSPCIILAMVLMITDSILHIVFP